MNIFSSCDLDPEEWHLVDKELYLGKAWTSKAYLYMSRKHEEELTDEDSVVIDIAVGKSRPKSLEGSDTAEQWESRPAGLWIKRSAKKHASDSAQAITNVDVLFGDDAVEVRQGWALAGGSPLLINTGGPLHNVQVTIRRGEKHEAKKPKPRIGDSGRFKIMQISDLHLSVGVGICREAIPDSYDGGKCEADPRTLDFVNRLLDDEKPDFVVLSGDQVNGDTAPDAPSVSLRPRSLSSITDIQIGHVQDHCSPD